MSEHQTESTYIDAVNPDRHGVERCDLLEELKVLGRQPDHAVAINDRDVSADGSLRRMQLMKLRPSILSLSMLWKEVQLMHLEKRLQFSRTASF